jgi:hypothetical protein
LGTASRLGIFQLAYKLKYDPRTTHADDIALREALEWLECHLDAPDILEKREHYRAICWFKDEAVKPISRCWTIKHILERYGYWIDLVKTRQPGLIIYQDGWQVVAKPKGLRLRI